jgi:hypothetical protein
MNIKIFNAFKNKNKRQSSFLDIANGINEMFKVYNYKLYKRCLPMNNNREKIESKMNKMMVNEYLNQKEMEILIEKNNGKVLILELMICLKELKITRKEEIGIIGLYLTR